MKNATSNNIATTSSFLLRIQESCICRHSFSFSRLLLFLSLLLVLLNPLHAASEILQFTHFTNQDGLPSSYVKSIVQDPDGFMWLATRAALTRFDGEEFREFPAYNEQGRQVKIYGDRLLITSDSVLIARTINGLYYYYDSNKECFREYSILNKVGRADVILSWEDGFWVRRNNKLFYLYTETGKLEEIREKLPYLNFKEEISFLNMLVRDHLLVALTDQGFILVVNMHSRKVNSISIPKELGSLSVNLFFIDSGENIWLGHSERGLAFINSVTGDYSIFAKEEVAGRRLPHNMVHCFAEDHQGRIWIGTEAGVALYSANNQELEVHSFSMDNPRGLNTNPIYAAYCDVDGNMWLGTYFGGVNLWSNDERFFRVWSPGLGKSQLRGHVVSCLTEDNEGNLWIGLEDNGLNKYCRETGLMKHYASSQDKNSLSYDNLHDLLFVSDNELWIASYTGGINVLNTKTNQFRHLNRSNTPGLTSDAVYSFLPVGDSVYISTSEGISIYNKRSNTFSRLKPEILGFTQFESMTTTRDKIWFSSGQGVYCYLPEIDSLYLFNRIPELSNISFVKSDSRGRVWIGDCYRGLCCYDEATGEMTYFNAETGFPVSWMFSLEEGKDGFFWASSDRGLVKFSPEKEVYILYDSNSGIPFNQFNYRASYIDRFGEIYFGGNSGMISFNESRDLKPSKEAKVVFTGFRLFNRQIAPGEINLLKQSINQSERIVLDYAQNVFTIEFSGLSYSSSGSCQYAYYLEGFENDWNYVGNRNFATYTNLSPGTYAFHVKASPDNIQEASNQRLLQIIVRPPFWLSGWAFAGYFIFACLFSLLVYKVGKNLEKARAMLLLERREREHADEIHKVKLEFFTNISHELKTPLTLIIGPLKRIMADGNLTPSLQKCLTGIERNASKLFNLINQLLEFRKIENGKERLNISECDFTVMMQSTAGYFTDLAEAKDIEFVVNYPSINQPVWIDQDKVDKIIINLLSNAFKFTKEGRRIEFSAEIVQRQDNRSEKLNDLEIKVADSGKGIHPEMIDKVFDRFFLVEDGNDNINSGIGLAFVKSLVLLHKGKVDVKSKIGEGTTFYVTIPASFSDYEVSEIVAQQPERFNPGVDASIISNHKKKRSMLMENDVSSRKPLILLVEDNSDLVNFLTEILELNYQVVSAANGILALDKLEHINPDLIISDIMMPEMDGIAFTSRIKSDLSTSHIPVILLTSKSGKANELEGLMTGADYYIEKPFFPDLLEQIIENVLSTRKHTIERFRDDAYFKVGELPHSDSDKVFFEKLTEVVKSNISDSTMDVSYLLNEMGVSRSLLHVKLKNMVGCSSTEFIRTIRLKEAVKLISAGKCNVSEAAYETGFSSPAYFTRCFKEFYGKSPREYFTN